MRVRALFLCPNVPFPPQNGGHHRNLGLIRALARFASVEVFAIGDPGDARGSLAREHLATLGATLSVYAPTGPGPAEDDSEDVERLPDAAAHFRSPVLADELSRRIEAASFDVVHVEELVMAQYADAFPGARVVDRQKVDWAYHHAMARVVSRGSVDHLREAARFLWWERRLAGTFDRILVPGEGDRRLLEPLHGPGSVSVVPIAIADDLCPPAEGARRVDYALLYGAQDYGPNVEAQQWFFQEVWPRLRAAAPTMRVLVVGSGRPPLAAELPPPDEGVEALGFVPEIRPVLQGAGALVVGVRVGGGVRTKVLEALACGMPVVSTAVGVENLDLVPGRDFLLAETAAEMADALLRLHRDPALRAALAREGPRRAEAFRWSRVEPTVEAVYRDVLAQAAARGPRHATPAESHAPPLDSPEVTRLVAELDALRRQGGPGPVRQGLRRLGRRLRRSAPIVSAECVVLRLLDSILTPATRSGLGERARRGLLRILRTFRRRR
jgi:glycosyltransferase involved in cell wall biosynthesis